MTKEFLNRANVIAVFQQMSGERMSERVATRPLLNFRSLYRPPDCLL
jgi:hypothetical protein